MLEQGGRTTDSDRDVLDRLVPLVYDELRRMARAQLRRDGHRLTLDTTGLVHEAYLKLVDGERAPVGSRGYFFGAASRAMRQVLVDHARSKNRQKRGGEHVRLALDERELLEMECDGRPLDLIVLDETLERLAAMDEVLGQIVELGPTERIFASPQHPYTRGLLAAVPSVDPQRRSAAAQVLGDVPSPADPPAGCRFHTRCPEAFDRCSQESPELFAVDGGRSRCFLSARPG